MMWWVEEGSPVVKALPSWMQHRTWLTDFHTLSWSLSLGLWTCHFTFLLLSEVDRVGWRGLGVGGLISRSLRLWVQPQLVNSGLVRVPWGLALFHRNLLPHSRQESIFLSPHIYCGSGSWAPRGQVWQPCAPPMTLAPWSFQLSELSALRVQQVVGSHSGVPALALVSTVFSVDESLLSEASPLCLISVVLGTSLRPGSSRLL